MLNFVAIVGVPVFIKNICVVLFFATLLSASGNCTCLGHENHDPAVTCSLVAHAANNMAGSSINVQDQRELTLKNLCLLPGANLVDALQKTIGKPSFTSAQSLMYQLKEMAYSPLDAEFDLDPHLLHAPLWYEKLVSTAAKGYIEL
jgi:hypothetical protein